MSNRKYTPRTQSKRWLDGDCPAQVLALYDNGGKSADRYTVLYRRVIYDAQGRPWIGGRGMNSEPMHPQGIGMYFESPAHEIAAWRSREKPTKWTDLPETVRACIRADCKGVP